MVPPEPRLPNARALIERGLYFVVHAPRQTGKTTALKALARHLTAEGKFAALYFSCETAAAARNDHGLMEDLVIHRIQQDSETELESQFAPPTSISALRAND